MSVGIQHASFSRLFFDALPYLLRRCGLEDVAAQAGDFRLSDPTSVEMVPIESTVDACIIADGDPKRFILVEMQRRPDPKKFWRWQQYAVQVALREQCDGILLILATDARTLSWAEDIAADIGHSGLAIRTLDASSFGVEWTPYAVRKHLAAALMTVVLHGSENTHNAAAHDALCTLIWTELRRLLAEQAFDPNTIKSYTYMLINGSSEQWQAMMKERDMIPKGWFFEQLEEKWMQGCEQGELRGELRGQLNTYRQSIRELAQRRGVALSTDTEQRLDECTDPQQLSRWLMNLATRRDPSRFLMN